MWHVYLCFVVVVVVVTSYFLFGIFLNIHSRVRERVKKICCFTFTDVKSAVIVALKYMRQISICIHMKIKPYVNTICKFTVSICLIGIYVHFYIEEILRGESVLEILKILTNNNQSYWIICERGSKFRKYFQYAKYHSIVICAPKIS